MSKAMMATTSRQPMYPSLSMPWPRLARFVRQEAPARLADPRRDPSSRRTPHPAGDDPIRQGAARPPRACHRWRDLPAGGCCRLSPPGSEAGRRRVRPCHALRAGAARRDVGHRLRAPRRPSDAVPLVVCVKVPRSWPWPAHLIGRPSPRRRAGHGEGLQGTGASATAGSCRPSGLPA